MLNTICNTFCPGYRDAIFNYAVDVSRSTSGFALNKAALRTLAGFSAAVAPFALVVHLAVEMLALGHSAQTPAFIVRHLYLAPLLGFSIWWYTTTLGLGRGRAELSRRCAILRARLRRPDGRYRFPGLVLANCGFFAVTQGVEGTPIASGSLTTFALCFAVAAIGSLLTALFIIRLCPSLLAAALVALSFIYSRNQAAPIAHVRYHLPTRTAAALFTLFRPKRPPPTLSLA